MAPCKTTKSLAFVKPQLCYSRNEVCTDVYNIIVGNILFICKQKYFYSHTDLVALVFAEKSL